MGSELGWKQETTLGGMLRDVHHARAAMHAARTRDNATRAYKAQADFVVSMEAYVGALEDARLPVPYLLRDELRICGRTLLKGTPQR